MSRHNSPAPETFRPEIAVFHGVFVNVLGAGVFIFGESGSGKSDCVLGLLSRGHRLVADDVVEFLLAGDDIIGRCPERFRCLLDINGIGILDVRRLFEDRLFEESCKLDFCVNLDNRGAWNGAGEFSNDADKLAIHDRKFRVFEIGGNGSRDFPLLVETAVNVFRLPAIRAGKELSVDHDRLVLKGDRKSG